jgi:hypothetical protein
VQIAPALLPMNRPTWETPVSPGNLAIRVSVLDGHPVALVWRELVFEWSGYPAAGPLG